MRTFSQWLVESPVVAGDYSLEHKFDEYNRQLFEGRIPKCPITWASLKGAGGITYYSHYGRTIVPGTLRIEMNTRFKRDEQGIDALVIHEMIHAFLAVTQGDGDGKHGWRFQSQAHRCSAIVGFQIPLKDWINELEPTDDTMKPLTAVLMTNKNKWAVHFYSANAFNTPEKMDELAAFWGLPDRMDPDQKMVVLKVTTNLASKYGMAKSVKQTTWHTLTTAESDDLFRRGQLVRTIEPNSISIGDARDKLPKREVLVVLQINPQRNTVYAVLFAPQIARDPVKMERLLDKWKRYHEPGVRNIEIFTTMTTLLNGGYTTTKDEMSGKYYMLKPDAVEELHRNAHYIQRWG